MHHAVNRKRLDNSSPLFGYFDPLLLIAACATASLGGLHLNFQIELMKEF